MLPCVYEVSEQGTPGKVPRRCLSIVCTVYLVLGSSSEVPGCMSLQQSACTQAAELLIMSFSYCPRQAIRQPSRLPQLYRNINFSGEPCVC
jgi:hypothetical protein